MQLRRGKEATKKEKRTESRIRLEVQSAKKESQRRGGGEDGLGEWIRNGNKPGSVLQRILDMNRYF